MAGKVKRVERTSSSALDALHFGYGASGHRIMKQVTDDPDLGEGYREHYIRDAQCLSRPSGSNIMATYRYSMPEVESVPIRTFELTERPLYGSSRLGSYTRKLNLYDADYDDDRGIAPALQADLHYELSDHLGNVTTVVSGRLLPGNGGGTIKQAEVLSAQGYEPFGSLLPGRNYSSDAYRFGFNGQEKDNEVYGSEGTSYTAEFWQYDTRTGRRWNLDPVDKPWQSRYSTFSGNPIARVDPKGDDDYFNANGVYLRSDNKRSRNIIIVQANGVQQQLHQVVFDKHNAPTLANVACYYAQFAGLDPTQLSGGGISVANVFLDDEYPGAEMQESLLNEGVVGSSRSHLKNS